MKNSKHNAPRLVLAAETAAELMTPNPVSIGADASLQDGLRLLADRGYSAAPVIDVAGRPVGVLSRADIIVHDREKVAHAQPVPDYYTKEELHARHGEALGKGFQVEAVSGTRVRDLMTPVVFSVRPETPVYKVVEDLVGLKVHRLFVVSEHGVLVGVISAVDVIRRLEPEGPRTWSETTKTVACK